VIIYGTFLFKAPAVLHEEHIKVKSCIKKHRTDNAASKIKTPHHNDDSIQQDMQQQQQKRKGGQPSVRANMERSSAT
jgi:hypothetical protein